MGYAVDKEESPPTGESDSGRGNGAKGVAPQPGQVPDIGAIMASIRDRITAQVQGASTEGGVDRPPPFRATPTDPERESSKRAIDLVHSEELRYLNSNYGYSSRLDLDRIKSHRPGILGRAIVKVKRKVLSVLWDSLLADYFAAEREYQGNLVRVLNDLTQYVGARDASMFWELVRKIDVDVGKALNRIEQINDQLSATIHTAERRILEQVGVTVRELQGGLNRVALHEDQIRVLDSVVRGLESILNNAKVGASADAGESSAASVAIKPIDYSYLLLENRFRGSSSEIAQRLAIYPQIFAGRTSPANSLPVLEIGAGRGELQALFKEAGVKSYGLDLDQAMVDEAARRGIEVKFGDGIAELSEAKEGSLGGIIAIQVVEHLTRDQLAQLIKLSAAKVAPGGRVVFETINPRSILALSSNYFRDPTHVFPMHPDTLGFMLSLAGFKIVETRFLSPVPDGARLAEIELGEFATPRWEMVVDRLNQNIRQLNELLYGYQDFCIVAERNG